ncbi:MAG: restriction endonuclease [Candidatus Aenigmarchaeota archaeon]|nr:restriction endonuclease [Candidatus Aenigmarchaeota archaeon]
MMIDEIEHKLRKNKTIEDVLEKYDWKKFEIVISEIFLANGFSTKQNFRFKVGRRYEIDVVASNGNKIFCVDCKWWNKGRYKKSGLKNAVRLQEIRVKEFAKLLNDNILARKSFKVDKKFKTIPLLVTLQDEDMIKENETFVVPVWKLNKFINEIYPF